MGVKSISIRQKLIRMIIAILLLSMGCTILTWTAMLLFGQSRMHAANYYERMIPATERQIKLEHDRIAEAAGQPILEQIIPAEGFKYKVVNQHGIFQYGNFPDQSDVAPSLLLANLNNVGGAPGNYLVKYIPISDTDDVWRGTLLIYYQLKVTPVDASDSRWLSIGILTILVTPFAYIALFTLLFVLKLSKEIKGPLEQLMVATTFIRNRDLQFSMKHYVKITEIRQLTEAFEQMRSELEQSLHREWTLQKERKQTIAALAHDIRTPLTIIQGHVEGLEEAKKRDIDRFDRYLTVIKNNVHRAVKLVHDLNHTAILEKESFQLQRVSFDPILFLEEKGNEYESWCSQENIRFGYELTDERSSKANIVADPDRLSQVLDNLISNSLRFAEQGKIKLEAWLTDAALRIKVTDNGPGFEKGKEEDVFQSFYQGRSGASRRNGHAGLGLYIAQSIIAKHGGEIKASNGPDGGAIIMFTIPLHESIGSMKE